MSNDARSAATYKAVSDVLDALKVLSEGPPKGEPPEPFAKIQCTGAGSWTWCETDSGYYCIWYGNQLVSCAYR
ncbi:hypothetical protein GCM10027090_02350 [Sinomonas soli]